MTTENIVIYQDEDGLVRVERRTKPATIVRARERMAVVIDYGGRSFGEIELDQTLANPDFAEALLRVLPNIAHSTDVADPQALVGVYQSSQGRKVTASGLVRGALAARRQQIMSISPWAIANGGANYARLELAGLLHPLEDESNLEVSIDGREMPQGYGWEVSSDGLAVNVWIPSASEIDRRLRYMQSRYVIRWYE
jgi:hypothetical protein